MQKLDVLEVLIEENVFGTVRPVEVVASAPVGALVPALVEELHLPQTDAKGKQRVYRLRAVHDGSILLDSQSLLASGVKQRARLALDSYVVDSPMMAGGSAQNYHGDPQFHASETLVDFNRLLQYPQTDRRGRENLMPPLMPSNVDNSNRVIPNMSSSFALGRDTDAHVQSIAQPVIKKPRWTRRAFLVGGLVLGAGSLGIGYAAYKGLLHGMSNPMVTHQVPVGIAAQRPFMPTKATPVFTFMQHQKIVRSVSWSPNGALLASGADDSQLYIWGVDGAVRQKVQFPASVHALAWSPEGQRLVVGSANQVVFMNATNGMVLARSTHRHTGIVNSVSWTPHNQMQVVSGAADMRAVVWNSTNYQFQYIFTRHTTPIEVVSWAADGQMVASSTHGGIIRVWNAANGQEAHGYYMDGQVPIRALAFAPSGMQLAAGGDDGIVRVWNGVNCQQQAKGQFGMQCTDVPQRFHVSTSAIRTVAWSPDARFLASGGNDGMLAVWYPAQQQQPLFTAQQNGSVHSITWSLDGKQLAVAAGNMVAVMKLV